jgi:glutathione S-transferase
MIKIHHLGVSQSDRIVWLMEELGLPYELVWYDRGADGMMPPAYVALHPAATAPVIEDGDLVLAESAAICEYVSQRHGAGRLSVAPDRPNYPDYLYFMHWNNNVQGMFFAKLASRAAQSDGGPVGGVLQRREDGYYRYLEQQLAKNAYVAGPDFTCADVMVTFNLTSLSRFGGRTIDDLPNVLAYVERITKRPAYAKAMQIAGPAAAKPKASPAPR